ncbi:MAG: site-specific DNA-methyltransferase [Xanthomonadales bacterium]|jgi:adenine-specific DNA-methyltransferase|nr:site-specific DNA-methyltransferase [Xanthomonadales bacterium]
MSTRNRLELTWVGKDQRPRLEPRILLEEPDYSHHAPARRSAADQFDNLLIHGDNLLALKALEADYAGKVKCIFIDPPYNTGSAFTHYDDGLEHSLWLGLIRDRLEIMYGLLRGDGSIWISIDDNEYAYLRLLCDELFGRSNFVATIIWEKRKSRENRRAFSFKHDYIVVYAKDKFSFEQIRNPVPINDEVLGRYRNPDNDPRGPWQSVAITAQAGHATASQFYTITTPGGREINPPPGNCWRFNRTRLAELVAEGRIYFGPDGNNVPRQKKFLSESEDAGLTPETIWYADDVGTNDTAKRHSNSIFSGNGFDSPKPEELIGRILHIATNPGDLVLDSFAGSGTTGAVAHKMGRRWIMVELGEHAKTHIVPRLKKVIDGQDPGGVTEACGWTGGGGFRFLHLAPSLMQKNAYGHWVFSPEYNAEMLAEAVCKHLGFRYAPRPEFWWMMGRSTERDYICVTTASLTHEDLRAISEEVGEERTLLVCCKAFMARPEVFQNLTVQKIPQSILHRCEWGRDDYSLRVANLPLADAGSATTPASVSPAAATPAKTPRTGDLFE